MNDIEIKQKAIKFARNSNAKSYLHENGLIDGYITGYKKAMEDLLDEIVKLYVPDGNPEIWLNKIQKLYNIT